MNVIREADLEAIRAEHGWLVNDKRVERIWRREGLKVPGRQPKKGRLWDGDGSCLRLKPERRDRVWSYDFVEACIHDGRKFRMLNVVDEFTRECLAIRVARKLKAADVIDVLSDLSFGLKKVAAGRANFSLSPHRDFESLAERRLVMRQCNLDSGALPDSSGQIP